MCAPLGGKIALRNYFFAEKENSRYAKSEWVIGGLASGRGRILAAPISRFAVVASRLFPLQFPRTKFETFCDARASNSLNARCQEKLCEKFQLLKFWMPTRSWPL